MRILTSLLVCLLTASCAGLPPPAQPPAHLLHDALFTATEPVGAHDIFALSEPMRRYLHTEIAAQLRGKGPQAGLVDALFDKGQLKLEYDATMTRDAAQAFAARTGNCLSLVILTAAFAKELGLQVHYQSAYLEETWSRSGSFLVRSGHVNVTLGRKRFDSSVFPQTNPLTIDFLPAEELRGLRTREIDERTVVAMFMNNRAVEALVAGRLDDAYGRVRAAIAQSPEFLASYNTLGVVYLRHGDLREAAAVFEHLLAHAPQNTQALANLALVYKRQARSAEAAALYRRLAQLQPEPPYHFFNLGLAAMQRNDFATARSLFAREVARADYNAEFHYWLALANLRLGDLEPAKKHLALALKNGTTAREQQLYAAKLDRLRGPAQ